MVKFMANINACWANIVDTIGLPLASLGVEKMNPNPDFTMGITNTFTYKTLVYTFC
jgi:hypothetical protein